MRTDHLPARNTDPDTSHEAAAKAVRRRPRVRDAVYLILSEQGPLTHDDLINAYRRNMLTVQGWPPASESSIRTRCSELVEDGLVVVADEGASSRLGNRARLWRAVPVQGKQTNVQEAV
jgi:hypothetical protein